MKKFILLIITTIIMTILLIGCTKEEHVISENLGTISNGEDEQDKNSENLQDNTDEKVDSIEEEIPEEIPVEYIDIAVDEVKIPILMYHSISDEDPNNDLLIPPAMFEEQMEWLNENNFTAMSMDEALEAINTGKAPKRPVVITFDDGYADNYESAFPVLKDNNMKGVFFVITDTTDKDGYYMSSNMLIEMKEAGMEIENHTSNHLELDKLSREDAYNSIKKGQDYLRNIIGSKGEYLCYPVGKYNDETIEIQKELGIKAAVTTKNGKSSINDGEHKLKRVRIFPMKIENFAGIFSEYIY